MSVLALIFAYTLESFGIYPCRLCFYQRYVYYGLIILSIIMILFIQKLPNKGLYSLRYIEYNIYLSFLIGISIGIFQLLIEMHLIDYNSPCTTSIGSITSPEELFTSISSKDLVPCDVPQIEILNLSLSGWNIIYMVFILCVSLLIMYKREKTKKNYGE